MKIKVDPTRTKKPKKDNSYTQKYILNSLEYSSLTDTTHRKETCLSQSPEQTIVFIFHHETTSIK